jgi:hypothetical protein
MIRRLALLFVLLAACAHHPPAKWPQPASAKLDAAEQAMFNSEYSTAKTSLRDVMALDAKRENRDRAARRLANIQWRIEGHAAAARRTLAPLVRSGPEQFAALLELSRLERTNNDFAAARDAAARAVRLARDPTERRNASVSVARAIVEPEKQRVLNGISHPERSRGTGAGGGARLAPTDPDPSTTPGMTEALAMLRTAVAEDPGRLTAARALLDAAVLVDDRDAIRAAWHSYFLTVGPSTILDPARTVIDRAGSDRLALAHALASSGFHDHAAIVAPEWKEIARYARFTRDAQRLTNEYYRKVALNDGVVAQADRDAYDRDLVALTESVWRDLIATPYDATIYDGNYTELGRRFGLYATKGETGGRRDLHAGHIVVDESRDIEQYGKRAKIRFIALDSMISNGYETWARDGRGEHGGWGDTGLIVQVRSAYAGGPLAEWVHLTDPGERTRADETIARESAADDARAAASPHTYLPGLYARLERQASQALYDELHAKGLQSEALRSAWMTEYARRELESSIFAHEGRHAIDAQYAPELTPNGAELEYRAKLSEIAFAPDPRLALVGGIVSPDIGSPSPHGKANARIMKVFVDWMQSHESEIAGLDAKRPLLPQLDKLTDEQLRAAVRAADPWATADLLNGK